MIYEKIMQTAFFNETYAQIEELKKDFPVNHGFIHVKHVIDNAKELAKIFKLNETQKERLLIAATLHDIGYLFGREDHPQNGAFHAEKFLKSQNYGLSDDDIHIICKAIANHGCKTEDECKDPISLCLILADKMDCVSSRYSDDTQNFPKVRPFKHIKKVVPEFDNNTFTMEIILDKPFTDETLEKYNNLHYFKKLREIFEKIESATKIKCDFNFLTPEETFKK